MARRHLRRTARTVAYALDNPIGSGGKWVIGGLVAAGLAIGGYFLYEKKAAAAAPPTWKVIKSAAAPDSTIACGTRFRVSMPAPTPTDIASFVTSVQQAGDLTNVVVYTPATMPTDWPSGDPNAAGVKLEASVVQGGSYYASGPMTIWEST